MTEKKGESPTFGHIVVTNTREGTRAENVRLSLVSLDSAPAEIGRFPKTLDFHGSAAIRHGEHPFYTFVIFYDHNEPLVCPNTPGASHKITRDGYYSAVVRTVSDNAKNAECNISFGYDNGQLYFRKA